MIYKFNNLSNSNSCIHGVTTKMCNEPQKFSLAMHTGENVDISFSNRIKAIDMLDIPKNIKIILASQTHSSNVVIVDEMDSRGWESMQDAVLDCDALISSRANVLIGVLTADCVPILLHDKQKTIVAAVHAGWRGTKANIVAKTVKIMQENFGCEKIIAGIGPSIGSCCYEVDEKLAKEFEQYQGAVSSIGGNYMLDLPLINRLQMIDAGVKDSNIEMSNICTACDNWNYFSYRFEHGCSGRFASFIGVRA